MIKKYIYDTFCNWKSPLFLIFLFFLSDVQVKAYKINLRVQHYTTEEGLSQNYIECIHKDSRGFIWVGTWNGLNRFDGYKFITYHPQKGKNSVSDGFINSIAEDKDGNLWIATRYGINKYIYETEKFIHFVKDSANPETSISDNWVSDLMFDNENNLWIGTFSSGVEKIVLNKELTEIISLQKFNVDFTDNKGISNKNIYCLLQARDGFIYAGGLTGLDRINPVTGMVLKYQDKNNPSFFEPTVVHCLFEDSKNVLWIGTEYGILSISNNTLTHYPVDKISTPGSNKKAISNGLIKAISEDPSGKILIATLGGLHLYDKVTKEFVLFPDNREKVYSLNNKFINCVLCDYYGNVWVGTEKGGLNKFNVYQKQFYSFTCDPGTANSLNHSIINSINEDEDYLWIGTSGGGLNLYDKKLNKFCYYTHNPNDPSSISGNFNSVMECKNNETWIGTWGRGLNKVIFSENNNKLTFKNYRYNPVEREGPPYSYISSIIHDKHNNLWIGRPDWLEVYDKKNDAFYIVSDGSAFGKQINGIGCLFLDSRDRLWVGTTGGLYMFKLKKGVSAKELSKPDSIFYFQHDPNDNESISGNFIVSILEDKTGTMWFSIFGNGICKLTHLSNNSLSAKFINYNVERELSNNVVYGMLEDNHNNLWLSTDRGLTKFNYISNTSTFFYESDGLQSNQFYWAAFYKNPDGIMYFGGTKGLNFFNPDSIKLNQMLPRVVITDFKLFNQSQFVSEDGKSILSKSITETSEIILKYNQNNISFEFSALSYSAPEKNQYKYILEGFDKEWTSTDSHRRYVSYTNMNPGEYNFNVMGSNNDGIWNIIPTSIKIIISPPWWKTIWFRIIFLISVMSLLFLFFRIRVHSLHTKKIELEKMVQDRTAELNESNKNLKKISETKDKLFTIIAHDLKNPFNVILGTLEIIVEKFDHYGNDKKKRLLDLAVISSHNLYRLLDNLLQWGWTQTGNFKFNPKNFSLKELILSNIRLLENMAGNKNINIVFDTSEDIMVFADENLTQTVVRNLLNNAIKFTKNGSIKVIMNKSFAEEENLAYIKIIDTGIGIEEQKLKNLFSIAGVHSNAGTNGETGTGLGLLLCHEFVVKNGGKIWVESEVNKGSCFTFTIPLTITQH